MPISKRSFWVLFLFVCVIAGLAYFALTKKGPVIEPEAVDTAQYLPATIRYQLELKNTSSRAVKDAEVEVFYPIETPSQKLEVLTTVPESGEKLQGKLHFTIPLVAPFAQKTLSVTAKVRLSPKATKASGTEHDKHLSDGQYLNIDSTELKQLLKTFESAAKKDKPKQFYQWVNKHIQYAGYIQEDRGASYALKSKKGDCTEYMYVLMAMLRASGIPARGYAGFYLQRSEQLVNASDYHNWVEFYDGEHWRILDPLNNNYDTGYGRYVALREITGKKKAGDISSQRFAVYDSRLAISMK